MRWQDETPTRELIAEGAQIGGAYLTVARVGEDRKEAQIGSHPIADVRDARVWLDRTAGAALGDAGDVRLRIRLWQADRTPVRGIQTRVWPDLEEAAPESDPTVSPGEAEAAEVHWDDDGEDATAATPMAPRHTLPPATSLAIHRPQPVATRTAPSARQPVRFHPRPAPVPAPMYAAPCPTCTAATTTAALLQSRIAELSALLGTAQTAVRDARRDTEEAQRVAQSRGRRAKEAEAEMARVRAENTELLGANRSLRREVKDLNEGAAKLLAALKAFDE